MDLKPGDRVRRAVGGPAMTVETVAAGSATCVWFDGADRHEAHLACDTLVLLPPERAGEDPFQTGQ
jgi:uncharacterized protein YodC (DUF2158 family)